MPTDVALHVGRRVRIPSDHRELLHLHQVVRTHLLREDRHAPGRALVQAGLHPATGGDGTFACSGDMLLEALVACAGVTLRAVATALGITVHRGVVHAEGDLDFRGTLGVDKAAPVGFGNIRLRFEVDCDADAEARATLLKLTERYCVVYQTLTQPPPINICLDQVEAGAGSA